jgi:hypothetical protein
MNQNPQTTVRQKLSQPAASTSSVGLISLPKTLKVVQKSYALVQQHTFSVEKTPKET